MKNLPVKITDIVFRPDILRHLRGNRTAREVGDSIGISPQRLSNYESGIRDPSAAVLLRLCVYYDLDIRDLANLSRTEIGKIRKSP